jgi:cytoskeletal protein RodZ
MYNRAFLRTYCDYLGMDSQSALEKLQAELVPPAERPLRNRPNFPQTPSNSRSHALLVWSVMLMVSITGLYLSRNWVAAVFSPYFSRPTAEQGLSPVTPIRSVSPSSTENTISPIQPQTALVTQELPVEDYETASEGIIPEDLSEDSASLKIDLEVIETCWLFINADSSEQSSVLLQPGRVRSFDAADHIYIILGNAGGVRIRVNGQPIKPLGKSGEVVKLLINRNNLGDLIQDTIG